MLIDKTTKINLAHVSKAIEKDKRTLVTNFERLGLDIIREKNSTSVLLVNLITKLLEISQENNDRRLKQNKEDTPKSSDKDESTGYAIEDYQKGGKVHLENPRMFKDFWDGVNSLTNALQKRQELIHINVIQEMLFELFTKVEGITDSIVNKASSITNNPDVIDQASEVASILKEYLKNELTNVVDKVTIRDQEILKEEELEKAVAIADVKKKKRDLEG